MGASRSFETRQKKNRGLHPWHEEEADMIHVALLRLPLRLHQRQMAAAALGLVFVVKLAFCATLWSEFAQSTQANIFVVFREPDKHAL